MGGHEEVARGTQSLGELVVARAQFFTGLSPKAGDGSLSKVRDSAKRVDFRNEKLSELLG